MKRPSYKPFCKEKTTVLEAQINEHDRIYKRFLQELKDIKKRIKTIEVELKRVRK